MNDYWIGWVAGLIEQAGYVSLNQWPILQVRLGSRSKALVDKVAEITEMGHISGPKKDRYVWRVSKRSDIKRLLAAVAPGLYEKQEMALDALALLLGQEKKQVMDGPRAPSWTKDELIEAGRPIIETELKLDVERRLANEQG